MELGPTSTNNDGHILDRDICYFIDSGRYFATKMVSVISTKHNDISSQLVWSCHQLLRKFGKLSKTFRVRASLEMTKTTT